MSRNNFKLAMKVTADTVQALREIHKVDTSIKGLHQNSAGRWVDEKGKFVSMNQQMGAYNQKLKVGSGLLARMGFMLKSLFAGMSFTKIFGSLKTGVFGVTKGLFSAGKFIVDKFSQALGLVTSIGKSILKWGAIGVGAVIGGGFLTHKLMGPAGRFERYKEMLKVQKIPEMFKYFQNTALKTPSSLEEIVSSGILMKNFKIDPKKYLQPIMDAANMFKKPIEEITRSLGYIKTGRFGEGLESLARIGITRDDLKELGIKFEKSGAVAKSSQGKVFGSIIDLFKSRFGGASERMAKLKEGRESMLGDALTNALAEGLKGFMPYYKSILDGLTDTVNKVGEALKALPWDSIGTKVTNAFAGLKNIVDKTFTSGGRDELWTQLKQVWVDIIELIKAVFVDVGMQLGKVLKSAWEYFGKWWDSVMHSKIVKAFVQGAEDAYFVWKHKGKSRNQVEVEKVQAERKDIKEALRQGYYLPGNKATVHAPWYSKWMGRLHPAAMGQAKLNLTEKDIKIFKSRLDYLGASEKILQQKIKKEGIAPKLDLPGFKWHETNKAVDNLKGSGKELISKYTPVKTDTKAMYKDLMPGKSSYIQAIKQMAVGSIAGIWDIQSQSKGLTGKINGEPVFSEGLHKSLNIKGEKAKITLENLKGDLQEAVKPLLGVLNNVLAENKALKEAIENNALNPFEQEIAGGYGT